MTQTTRASEMTIEQIEQVLQDMNWTEIHKARVFSDYGASIVIYTDGEFSVQDQGTHYRDPDAAGVIAYLPCWGRGNIDRTHYYEGWADEAERSHWTTEDPDRYSVVIHRETGEEVDSGDWIETETGRIIGTTDQMIEEAIEEGSWYYDEDIDLVLEHAKYAREEAKAKAKADADWRERAYAPETYGMEENERRG